MVVRLLLGTPFAALGVSSDALTHRYDPLFAKYGHGFPVAFLRALAKKESNFNPEETQGSYWGLLQVGWRPSASATAVGKDDSVLGGYNERRGTRYTREDLLKPSVNIAVATDLLRRIVQSYERYHPDVANMQENWRNPEFVRLVLAGWNSGYSEGGGVGKVADYLQARGLPVTHANVFEYAGSAGATKHLQNDTKRQWQRSVADLFYAQPDAFTAYGRRIALLAPFPFLFPWGRPESHFSGAQRAGTERGLGASWDFQTRAGLAGGAAGGLAALGLMLIAGVITALAKEQ